MSLATTPVVDHRNEVLLVGRIAGEPTITVLPSGDEVLTARVVVERPRPPAGRGKRGQVDTVPCAAWTPALRRSMRTWQQGDLVEVTGSLRRRFWRREDGPRSRYEVEIRAATRLVPAPSGESAVLTG